MSVKEMAVARVPVTLLIEFVLRGAPCNGYNVFAVYTKVALILIKNNLRVADILIACELLVLEGRAN